MLLLRWKCIPKVKEFIMEIKKNIKMGFTLAEVLITLGIIGVVAALTIPSLIADYQNTQYIVGLKKSYAEMTEALKLMAIDNGCDDDLNCTGVFKDYGTPESNNIALATELKKHIKVAKDCGTSYDGSVICMSTAFSFNYDGTGGRNSWLSQFPGYYNFITADGFSISLKNEGANCSDNYSASGQSNLNVSKTCGQIIVDVNGLKGPNNLGKDIFDFLITNGKGPALYPFGGSELIDSAQTGGAWDDASGNPINCYEHSTDGWYCAGRIMEQGWQIKYVTPPPPPANENP